jgi:hypothetical protein
VKYIITEKDLSSGVYSIKIIDIYKREYSKSSKHVKKLSLSML